MNNPQVSIVIPSYNHEKFVKQAISSAINQTYNNIQLIVIDDGSKDDSPVILQKLQKEYNFYLECRTNHGLIPTLNYALKNLVTGKYVCLLASDDYWDLTKIEKQVRMLETNPSCGLCHSGVFLVQNDIVTVDIDNSPKKDGYIFEELLLRRIKIFAPSVMIPYDIYREFNYYDETFPIEDYPFWLTVSEKYEACYIEEPLLYYRIHGSNMSNNDNKMLLIEEAILAKWENNLIFQKLKNQIYLRWFVLFSKFDKKKALKYLTLIISNAPTYTNKNFYKGLRRLLLKW